uniref:Endoglucanase n=2 Tax=Physcomitrium patens TaxID=3218 RepID=A0A2K1J795_PHYPA|nr:endoglucanase 25-like [Physcomitrium patens]XP_024398373.1 endoglucanase 25-like [Physcomitrium patens]XP_024398375.1 endoglucanase 25-like [Physcomitrium patens]XP_024398376.1 endoglucanase 25-like [Physcomitrium patens]XP_024398377.1 endoglucanase 25-like [Physcomitrium patens]PNR37396.1 hypothetical protein PHYPA_020505 [Physcomitrium patens]|eukprot:XP_024398372.1 endoglucanase 25-like [Physcomitrella patens]
MNNNQLNPEGPLEMSKQWSSRSRFQDFSDDDRSNRYSFSDIGRTDESSSSHMLDETQLSWMLEPKSMKKKPVIDFGCVSCNRKCFWWSIGILGASVIIIGLSLVIWTFTPKKHSTPPTVDNYTVALSKALTFLDLQKSGALRSGANTTSWRGSSALLDGQAILNSTAAINLAGGFYDAGDNIKFSFTGAYAMTLLSWSVIEYKAKFQAAAELDHVKNLIKWGTDYLLKTFNSSSVDEIVCQVGMGGGKIPNDHHCWERPEDLDYFNDTRRLGIQVPSGSDLAGEMAAALSAASIVFKDQPLYALKLLTSAEALYAFAKKRPSRYVDSDSLPVSERVFYNSTSFDDEIIWASSWLYFATGNATYLDDATISAIDNSNQAGANAFGAFDWDSKLAGAQLLLTRLRMLQGPGYPYEQALRQYNNETNLVVCAYIPQFEIFHRTKGGLVLINPNATQHLPAAVNAAFLAALYADYLKAADVPAIECGPDMFSPDVLRDFSRSQVDYVLGKNPLNMSYLVGYSDKFPLQPHHRAASFPSDGKRYSCREGWKWRDRDSPNPHVLVGAMVGGPDNYDRFNDTRSSSDQNEPTLAGNAGLVGALVALAAATTGVSKSLDTNFIFAAIPSHMTPPAQSGAP